LTRYYVGKVQYAFGNSLSYINLNSYEKNTYEKNINFLFIFNILKKGKKVNSIKIFAKLGNYGIDGKSEWCGRGEHAPK